MCGIAGFVDYNKRSDLTILQKMINILEYRGPDDKGFSFYKKDKFFIGLGHRRLAILDLSENGHQPMKYEHLEIIYNGEVYNYKELRNDLIKLGYHFISHTDTEVILKGFHCWGTELFKNLNGMFSIVIYDHAVEKLFLIRDRVGIKPLYTYDDGNLILFSSELKAFHMHPMFKKEINDLGVCEYFKYGYNVDNNVFKNVNKVKQGTYLQIDLKTKRQEEYLYWSIDVQEKNNDFISAKKQLNKLLIDSIRYRLVSDVEVGSFLSGGYDSTLVTVIAQKLNNKKIKTFTIGFDDKDYDESKYAFHISKYLDTDHYEYICSKDDFIEIFKNLDFILDEPMADSSIIPTTIVSKIASEHVKVSLSGDGGDELFGGYSSYIKAIKFKKNISFNFIGRNLKKISNVFYNRKLSRLQSRLNANNLIDYHNSYANKFTDIDLKFILKRYEFYEINELKSIKKNIDLKPYLTFKDFKTSLPEQLLLKVDKSSMFNSLEARVPLLDHNIVEFAYSLSNDLKFKNGGKFLLKELTYDYIPKNLLDRPKKGFSIPLKEWLSGNINDMIAKYTDKNFIKKQNIFNENFINYLLHTYHNGNFNSSQLWSFIVFQMWYDKWIGSR